MTDTAGPFDGAPWAEAQWSRHAARWAPSAVSGAPAASTTTGDLPLSVSGLSVGLGAGRAWVRGFGFERTGAAVMQSVTANTHASFSRRDRIVLRRNLATHTLAPVLITGTPAGTPAAPALTQSETGSWDLPLFSFLVPPNSGTTISGVIDERPWSDNWDSTDKATQAMISLNATQPLGVAGTLYQLQNADWDSVVDHGDGHLTLVGGAIRCERAGRVRVDALAVSDAADAGWSWLAVGIPFQGGNHLGGLDDRRGRQTGIPGVGQLRQAISAGPVIVQSGDLISFSVAQQNTANLAVNYQCYLAVTYVGLP